MFILNLKQFYMRKSTKYGKNADIALDLWVKLARAYATFGKLSALSIKRFGLTEPQFAVIECLGHLGSMTLTTLSKKMLVSNGNVTCVVKHLVSVGILEKKISEEDKRARKVQLTVAGQQLFKSIFIQHAKFVEKAASVLTQREQLTLSRLLKKLGLALQNHVNQNNHHQEIGK